MSAPGPRITVEGVEVPTLLYGTAWKEDATERLMLAALEAGFRGIDTANQRRHYHEAAVGAALRRAADDGTARREELFLQTKFTHPMGQDHRMPYDPAEPTARQVDASFRSSLEHLGVDRLDSLVLHGPSSPRGLAPEDVEAWRAMEDIHEAGGTRLLGASNLRPPQLEELLERARVRPAFLQNRCFARMGWDRPAREICAREGIVYQGFSLLTGNPEVLRHETVRGMAGRHDRTVPQVIFRFALALGMIPLTGTTNPDHMRDDLAVHDFELTSEEVDALESLAG